MVVVECILRIFLTVLLMMCITVSSTHAFNSMLEFESNATTDGGIDYLANLDNCFTSGKAAYPWEYGEFNNICIPTMLSKNRNSCSGQGVGGLALTVNASRGAVYVAMSAIFAPITFLALAIEYIIMLDLCTNAYIVAPHEYINLEQGKINCRDMGEVVVNVHQDALTSIDVPFFYHCDPFYDPDTGTTLQAGKPEDEPLIGRTWGYMGAASPYCAGDASQYAKPNLVGKVIIHYVSGWDRFWGGMDNRCQKGGHGSPEREQIILATKKSENGKYNSPAHYYAYYRFASGIGKIQLCVVAPFTLLPIKIGCSYVPPPADDLEIDNFLKVYLQDTRCYYFITGRTDLNSLGKSLRLTDGGGVKKQYVKDFFSSDMHVISTVIGCMQDLLTKVFINPSTVSAHGNKPFFQIVQERLKQIVYSVLILYISIVGIKIITSAELPQRGEWAMYLIKFALVIYFATGSVWYEIKNGEKEGLYPALLAASSEITGFFMGAQNDNDPIGFCNYSFDNENLFAERVIEVSGSGIQGSILEKPIEATKGFNNQLKLTVWDLIDCKLLNYLNFGSCKYTISGLIGVWIISAALFAGIVGFLLGLISFIYCLMLLLVLFKFTHIFILSMFVITILVLVSPIMVCFALFDYTKSIFQKWMQLIIGYILYPSMLFAFIALMLATFDAVFFGDIDLVANHNDVQKACAGVESVFCSTYNAVGYDPCSANLGHINSTMTETLDLGPLGKFTILKIEFANAYLNEVLKLMLFAFIFYLFMDSVSSFLAVLTGVQDLSGMAKGSVNLLSAAGSMMSGSSAGGSSSGSGSRSYGGPEGGAAGGDSGNNDDSKDSKPRPSTTN